MGITFSRCNKEKLIEQAFSVNMGGFNNIFNSNSMRIRFVFCFRWSNKFFLLTFHRTNKQWQPVVWCLISFQYYEATRVYVESLVRPNKGKIELHWLSIPRWHGIPPNFWHWRFDGWCNFCNLGVGKKRVWVEFSWDVRRNLKFNYEWRIWKWDF